MPRITITCEICGDKKEKWPSQIREGSAGPFCGKSCARTYLNMVDNPSKHRDISGDKNPMYGRSQTAWNKGIRGEHAHNWRGGIHKRTDGYVRINVDGKRKLMHRHLLEESGVKLEGKVVHHKDHNPSNNELSNLMVFDNQSEHVKYEARDGHRDQSDQPLEPTQEPKSSSGRQE
jgi:endogenous inhibitor of DNA gyrase (YacG/DUF329 family)